MPQHTPIRSVVYLTPCVAVVVVCALTIIAQSGRRVRKPVLVAAPTPEATPAPAPTPKPKPTFKFILGLDKYEDFSRVSLNVFSGVLQNCASRLDEAPFVEAEISTHDMSRADATRQAKEEKEAYIVWLQLRPNTFTGNSNIYGNPNDVYISYTVLAPGTGKQATSGNTYPEAYRNKRVRIPTTPNDGDYYLNQAARAAAERILAHFNLGVRNTTP